MRGFYSALTSAFANSMSKRELSRLASSKPKSRPRMGSAFIERLGELSGELGDYERDSRVRQDRNNDSDNGVEDCIFRSGNTLWIAV
jgi:hypothetical protein